MFYSSDPRRVDLVEYEENLSTNLDDLLLRITGEDENWATDSTFVGGFTVAPKPLDDPKVERTSFWSVPAEAWRNLTDQAVQRPTAAFRIMSRCSIDLHIFSTLWMLEVGTVLDSRLRDNAMGNRLRSAPGEDPDRLSSGTFRHYQPAYQRWRDRGLQAMTEALNEGKNVIALTGDVSSFYHRLDPAFILDARYLTEVLRVNLDAEQTKLTRLFVAALHAWSTTVSTYAGWVDRGLPVGLPASAVVANLALAQLDGIVVEDMKPLYYGRYVDDVLLVLEDPGGIANQRALWEWMIGRSRNLLTLDPPPLASASSDRPSAAIYFNPPYLQRSVIAFENRKNKTFHLSGASGGGLIESIRSTIRERSSEWRSLANVPSEVDQIEHAIMSVRRSDGDAAATLRDADRVSARKQGFAVRLRDFEYFDRNLPPAEWARQRSEFFRVTCEQILSLPSFFELAAYLPRLIGLAASCHDTQALSTMFAAIAQLPAEVRTTCQVTVAAYTPAYRAEAQPGDVDGRIATIVLDAWASQLLNQATENLISGWSGSISVRELQTILAPLRPYADEAVRPLPSVTRLKAEHRRMAQRDLAYRPYRWSLFDLPNADRIKPIERAPVPLHPTLESGLDLLVENLRLRPGQPRFDLRLPGNANAGLAFATRPPSAMELYVALPSRDRRRYGVSDGRMVGRILLAMRGYSGDFPAKIKVRSGWPTVIQVLTPARKQTARVALTMLETDVQDAMAAAKGTPNLSLQRLTHIRELLNTVARHSDRPDYLLLPELAMPAQWFAEFARGLRRSGISLIAGIEHQPRGRTGVTNQVWAALRLDGFGLQFFVYQQDKQRPARPEAKEVLGPAGRSLNPARKWRFPPVIEHTGLRFALLICSELTNIAYRAHLRGAVDTLFVPEWNQDLHSFEALVESSALDLHSYIAQANTRGFGDSRLRAPMKEQWDRDVVRLKGGSHDYFVVGAVDHNKLRAFQASGGSVSGDSSKTFKPLPDGFKMDPERA